MSETPSGGVSRFYLATLGWTWGLWIPLVLLTNSLGDVTTLDLPVWQRIALLLWLQLGAYGPSIVAIVLSTRRFGGAGAAALLKRLLVWRVPFRWYLIALVLPGVLQTVALLTFPGSVGAVDWSRALLVPTTFLTLLLFGPLAEELGWRGYLLPRLLTSGSALRAALAMGAMVTLWHCPLFLSTFPPVYGVDLFDVTIVYYLAYTTARCVLYTWIFQNTRQSVLMTVLFHAAGNTAAPLLLLSELPPETKSEIILWSGLVMWVFAAWVLRTYGWQRLTR